MDIVKDYVIASFKERRDKASKKVDSITWDTSDEQLLVISTYVMDLLMKFSRMLPKDALDFWIKEIYPKSGDLNRQGIADAMEYLKTLDTDKFDDREVTTVASGLFDDLVQGCPYKAEKELLWRLMETVEPEVLLSNDIIFD